MRNSIAFKRLNKILPDISSIEYHENEWFIVLDTSNGIIVLTMEMVSFWTKFWFRMFLIGQALNPNK